MLLSVVAVHSKHAPRVTDTEDFLGGTLVQSCEATMALYH